MPNNWDHNKIEKITEKKMSHFSGKSDTYKFEFCTKYAFQDMTVSRYQGHLLSLHNTVVQ